MISRENSFAENLAWAIVIALVVCTGLKLFQLALPYIKLLLCWFSL